MPYSYHNTDIQFDGPANYRIVVKGWIDDFWFEIWGGLQINYRMNRDKSGVTILSGQIKDQAELKGILDSIYELHIPILTVENLNKR